MTRPTQADAMAAADWLRQSNRYLVNHATDTERGARKTGWWVVLKQPTLFNRPTGMTDTEIIEFAKREGRP